MTSRPGDDLPPLHLLVPDSILRDTAASDRLLRLQKACGPGLALHLRGRKVPAGVLYDRAREAVRGAEAHGGWCVVNGRADVARAAGAHAVQVGRGSPPLSALRPHLGLRLRVGVSVHGAEAALRAAALGANYLLLGTIFATPSHPDRAGAGPELVRRVTTALVRAPRSAPVVAIGGIDLPRVPEVLAAGAAGIAVLRAVWDSADPAAAARALLEALGAPLTGRPVKQGGST